MRNLKRALSLALASVMVLGLMVVGSSAKGYDDVTSEENVEAIEVLQAVGIMTGDDNGNFNPTQNVTRNEMAVIMSNLMDYRVATYKGTSPFTDVPEWAEPYVAACYTNGIIAGYSATTFGGSDPVVTSQATLMILKALGYFQSASDFGDDWQLATINQANRVDLLKDVDSAVRVPMTRNDVAQLVLNGLEGGTVEADTSNNINVTVGDAMVSVGGTKYNYVTIDRKYAYAISSKIPTASTSATVGAIVELGEKLYQGDLTKDEDYDDLGRPASVWEYQAKEIGTYADAADYTWTAKVTSKTLYNTITRTAAEYPNWRVTFNGEPVDYDGADLVANRNNADADFYKAAKGGDALTGNGVRTEVYVDGTTKTVTIAITEFYAAEVLKVKEDDGTITLANLSADGHKHAKSTDTFETDKFAEDDIVVYSYAQDKIQEVYAAERMEGEVTAVRSSTKINNGEGGYEKDGDSFVVDGTTYKYNVTTQSGRLLTENLNNNVVAYLDANGYVIYVDQSAITYDFAYVLSMGTDKDMYGFGSGDRGTTVYARLVLSDGSMIKVQTDAKKSEIGHSEADGTFTPTADGLLNHIVSYTKDKNGVYTLVNKSETRYIDNATTLEVNNGVSSFIAENGNRYSANANTVFVIAERDGDSFDDYNYTVYTGVKNVPDIKGHGTIDNVAGTQTTAVVATGSNTTGSTLAKMVYIEDADVSGEDVIFVRGALTPDLLKDNDKGEYYEVTAFRGEDQFTMQIKSGSAAHRDLIKAINAYGLPVTASGDKRIVAIKSYTENADGLVTSVRAYDAYSAASGDGVITGKGTGKSETAVLGLFNQTAGVGTGNAKLWFTWNDDVIVGRYGEESVGKFVGYRINSVKRDSNFPYIAIVDGDVLTGVVVYENASGSTGGGQGNNGTFDSFVNTGSGNADVQYYGDLSAAELASYIKNACETASGIAVESYNQATGIVKFADGTTLNITPVRMYKITQGTNSGYVRTSGGTVSGLDQGTYLANGDVSGAGNAPITVGADGKATLGATTADMTLTKASKVSYTGMSIADVTSGSYVTVNKELTVTATGQGNAQVKNLLNNGVVVATATSDASGNISWTFTVPDTDAVLTIDATAIYKVQVLTGKDENNAPVYAEIASKPANEGVTIPAQYGKYFFVDNVNNYGAKVGITVDAGIVYSVTASDDSDSDKVITLVPGALVTAVEDETGIAATLDGPADGNVAAAGCTITPTGKAGYEVKVNGTVMASYTVTADDVKNSVTLNCTQSLKQYEQINSESSLKNIFGNNVNEWPSMVKGVYKVLSYGLEQNYDPATKTISLSGSVNDVSEHDDNTELQDAMKAFSNEAVGASKEEFMRTYDLTTGDKWAFTLVVAGNHIYNIVVVEKAGTTGYKILVRDSETGEVTLHDEVELAFGEVNHTIDVTGLR